MIPRFYLVKPRQHLPELYGFSLANCRAVWYLSLIHISATPAEAAEIVKTIYASGYPDRMVLQKMVPGGARCVTWARGYGRWRWGISRRWGLTWAPPTWAAGRCWMCRSARALSLIHI